MVMGCAMRGSDGEVGAVSDLLFDDTTWRLRWIVVNTRYWFPSHEVLLPAAAMGRSNPSQHWLATHLAMRQIEPGPQPGAISRSRGRRPPRDPATPILAASKPSMDIMFICSMAWSALSRSSS